MFFSHDLCPLHPSSAPVANEAANTDIISQLSFTHNSKIVRKNFEAREESVSDDRIGISARIIAVWFEGIVKFE